jgi:hypothetical protein
MKIPTSDKESFLKQLDNVNISLSAECEVNNISKITKNLVISYVSDSAGCGHIRNIFPMTYINSIFAREGSIIPMIAPFFLFQHDLLIRTRSIFFQRTMSPAQLPHIQQYKELQKNYNYKMIYDIDDFIWYGENGFEGIPSYNFASTTIGDDTKKASIEIMNMMDIVCVSTNFLKDYLSKNGVKTNIVVINNTVPKYFWHDLRRSNIKEIIKKPRVIYTGSPTHYNSKLQLLGDIAANNNAWLEWIIKNVKDNKIDFMCMGSPQEGVPFFFKSIESKMISVKWVNSFKYHLPILKYKPDINLMPLVPNMFNFSKSNIKYIESCAAGSIGVGSVFTCGYPSPYDENIVKIPDTYTYEQFDNKIQESLEPNTFNDIIDKQYKQLNENGWWLESDKFINKIVSLF